MYLCKIWGIKALKKSFVGNKTFESIKTKKNDQSCLIFLREKLGSMMYICLDIHKNVLNSSENWSFFSKHLQ